MIWFITLWAIIAALAIVTYILYSIDMKKQPAKDPMDPAETKTSTGWSEYRYCGSCDSHWPFPCISDHRTCPHCGQRNSSRYGSIRKIWNGKRWVEQIRVGDEHIVNGVAYEQIH